MRSFWKMSQIQVTAPLMIEIMRHRDELFADGAVAKTMPRDAGRIALAILQITNSVALVNTELMLVGHDQKVVFTKTEPNQNYIAVLSGQIMCMAGEECPALNPGEIWWLDSREDAIVINKSGDDAVALFVTVTPE